MIRLLHLADLHLGWEPSYMPGEKAAVRKNERDQLLKKAVDFAIAPENKIQGVIIAGDLFEKYNPDKSLVNSVLEDLGRITGAGLMLVTVPGNHDEITYRESVYRKKADEWPGCLVKEPMPCHCLTHTIEGCPVHIYSLAYTGGVTKPGNIKVFPRLAQDGFHIGAFHGSLDWEGLSDRSLPLTSEMLSQAGYGYVALGHYHQFIIKPLKNGKGIAVYPGAVEFKSFSDPGTGKFTVIKWDGKKAEAETHQADVRRYETVSVDISGIKRYEDLLEACGTGIDPDKIVQMQLTGAPAFQIDREKLTGDLEKSCFYVEMKGLTQYYSDAYLDIISKEPTLRGLFVRNMRETLEDAKDEDDRQMIEIALTEGLNALEGSDQHE